MRSCSKGEPIGELEYDEGAVIGEVTCPDGQTRPVYGDALDRTISLTLLPPGEEPPTGGAAPATGSEHVTAEKQREAGSRFAAFFIAVVVVMLVARLFGMGAAALGQPRVMGEVIAGICLGPTVLGAIAPEVSDALFPSDIIPFIGVVAQLGLVFYMFLVGLEVDLGQLKGRIGQVAAISNVSVALPMMLGFAVALPIYELVGPDKKFVGVRPLHGRLDVDHRLPGAGAHPGGAADAQAAGRRAGAGLRRHRRRHGLVPDRACDGRRGGRLGKRRARDDPAGAGVLPRHGLRRPAAPVAGVHGIRRVGTRAGRLGGADLRRGAAVRLHHRGDRHRPDLRRLRDGPDHAAPRRVDRGRDRPHRGLHDHPAAPALLRLHGPEDRTWACSTGRSCGS